MNIQKYKEIQSYCDENNTTLVAVSKTHPVESINEAYQLGIRNFGENKVQELISKESQLPKDIQWHLIGHLQSNKIKYIAPFIYMIHSVDSFKLLKEINKEGMKNNRIIQCLLQIYIAKEDTKFGLTNDELINLLQHPELSTCTHIKIVGLMGMASNTDNQEIIKNEFQQLKVTFDTCKQKYSLSNIEWKHLSMGMTSDYKIAIACGSSMVRIGSAIFGNR